MDTDKKKIETYTAEVEVRVTYDNDRPEIIEVWQGISRRHALLRARAHYRDVARADFANGEPY